MNKFLLLAIPFLLTGCDSSYSVDDFKKDDELSKQWAVKCASLSNPSDTTIKNCRNFQTAMYENLQESINNRTLRK